MVGQLGGWALQKTDECRMKGSGMDGVLVLILSRPDKYAPSFSSFTHLETQNHSLHLWLLLQTRVSAEGLAESFEVWQRGPFDFRLPKS